MQFSPSSSNKVPMSEHRFSIGEIYENEKGAFKVLVIKGDKMLIEWDDGEQFKTDTAFQERVQVRMEKDANARTKGKSGPKPAWMGRSFTGLLASDFKDDVTGTHWRSREQLGGAVTCLLNSKEPMNSWSIYRRPHLHWAAMGRYRLEPAWLLAKFFFMMREDCGVFGYFVERSSKDGDTRKDWIDFVNWMSADGHAAWLHAQLQKHDLAIFDPYPETDLEFNRSIVPLEKGWMIERSGSKNEDLEISQLGGYLAALDGGKWVNLVIGKRVPADVLIAQGAGVATTIADCFNALMPVYENSMPRS